MRGTFFGLRSGTSSVIGSPVQTPANAPQQPLVPQPSSNSRPDSGVYVSDVVEPLSLPPSAAADLTNNANTARAGPLTRLGLTAAFRKPSPVGATRPRDSSFSTNTPAHGPTPPASPAPPGPTSSSVSVSYLDGLGLRLGEAVSKALILPPVPSPSMGGMGMGIAKAAHVASTAKSTNGGIGGNEAYDMVLKGKKPLPTGRGRTLGALIAGELQSASQDPFLYRAVLRLLQRPLSVLLTNLTTQVTNLILTPDFAYMSTLAPLNATQVHALALAHFASEVLETFDAIGLGRIAQRNNVNQAAPGPDGLRADREALESVISKVVGPFLGTMKRELSGALVEFEKDSSTITQLEKTLLRIGPILGKVTFAGEPNQASFVQSLQAQLEIGTIWGCLTGLADRSLPRVSSSMGSQDGSGNNEVVRRSVSAAELRARAVSDAALLEKSGGGDSPTAEYVHELPSYVTPPDTPQVAPADVTEKEKKRSSSSSSPAIKSGQASVPQPLSRTFTPPTPPVAKKLSLPKLPSLKPLTASRAPSPSQGAALTTWDEKTLLASTSTSTSSSSVSSAGQDASDNLVIALKALARDAATVSNAIKRLPLPLEGGLARDAVDEATKEMTGFVEFVEYLSTSTSSHTSLQGRLTDIESLLRKTRETPMLLSLPVLLRIATATSTTSLPSTVAAWIGLSETEYRETCLSGGFRKADECAVIVGKAVLRNRTVGMSGVGWMREWVERSTREEEEEESDDEDGGLF